MEPRQLTVIRILLFVARMVAFDEGTRKEIESIANHIGYSLKEAK